MIVASRIRGDFRRLLRLLVIPLALLLAPAPAFAFTPTYATEQDAAKACPTDTVVWLNTASGVYHLKGQRWYGRTKSGGYACRKQADATGARMTRNGQ